MALSGTENRTSFTATASQTTFTFTIPFFDATTVDVSAKKFGDIKVTREAASDGTLTELTPNASPSTVDQFKIAATNNDPSQGCTVTIGAGATANDIYTVERDVKTTQQYDLQEGSTIDPTALNKAFDRIVAQNQQQDDKLNNSITFPATDASTITYNVDSSASSRANKALGFDSSGNITELSLVSAGSVAGNTNAGINVADNTISATIDTNHMEFNGGNISIKADGVTSTELANDAVDTAAITNNAVTTAKLPNSTSKTDGVTFAKLQHISTDKVLGKLSAGEGDVEEITVDEDLSSVSANHDSLATAKAIKDYFNLKPSVSYYTMNARGSNSSGSGDLRNWRWANWVEYENIGTVSDIVSIADLVYTNNHGDSISLPNGTWTFASTGTYLIEISALVFDSDSTSSDLYKLALTKADNMSSDTDTSMVGTIWTTSQAALVHDDARKCLIAMTHDNDDNVTVTEVALIQVSDTSTDKLQIACDDVSDSARQQWEGRGKIKITKIS